jgi:hypothetical protein
MDRDEVNPAKDSGDEGLSEHHTSPTFVPGYLVHDQHSAAVKEAEDHIKTNSEE